MQKLLVFLLLAAATLAGAAQSQPIVWNFEGHINYCTSTPEFSAYVGCWSPWDTALVRGTLAFEDSTPAHITDYGSEFWIPTAVFDAQVDRLHVHGSGAHARISPNGDEIRFYGTLDSSDFPAFSIYGNWEIYIFAWLEGFYSADHLPSWPAPTPGEDGPWPDESFDIWMGYCESDDRCVNDHAAAVYVFGVERLAPEPAPLAIYFGLGVILISMRRLRGSVPSATRRLVAPRP